MSKEMSIFIQTSQVLGCATLVLLENNRRTLNLDEFMYICATVDGTIRKKCNAVLEIYNTKVHTVVDTYSNIFDRRRTDIYIKERVTKKAIEYYFTSSLPNDVKKIICGIFNEKLMSA